MNDILSFLERYGGVFVACAGLIWAVIAFWWRYWHKGRIAGSTPRTYAAISHQKDDFLLVRLPIVFRNTGAAAILVQNLRLTLGQNGRKSPLLYFNQTLSKLDVGQEGDWAKQFRVEGREAVSLICEFLRKPREGFVFSAGDCDAVLEGKFDEDKDWKVIVKFKLRIAERYLSTLNSIGPLIAYDNDPDREMP